MRSLVDTAPRSGTSLPGLLLLLSSCALLGNLMWGAPAEARDIDGTTQGPLTLLDGEALNVLPGVTLTGSLTSAVTGGRTTTPT